ncbi:MAG: imidazolonepropionase [Clostridiaceae bacterium]
MRKVLIINASQIATPMGHQGKKGADMGTLLTIEDGAIYIENGIIKDIEKTEEIKKKVDIKDCEIIDASGKCILPGFVDSHTHFIFGGYREDEFIKRLEGTQYLDILKMGGGIQCTVKSTREAGFEELYELGLERLNGMIAQGITTIEGKSGYGLDLECELKQLKVMKELDNNSPIDIISTFLGAHAIPAEYKNSSDEYVDYIIKEVLPRVAEEKLSEFCDVFCEEGVFSIEQSRRLLQEGQKLGLKSKIHADEIVQLGGGELAGEIGAVSADHLLMVSDEGIEKLSNNNVIATLLPCTAFCLAKPYAPARKIIDRGGAVALASDFNPGSCFSSSVPLMLALAVIHMKMTIEEAITAITLNGAAAIDKADRIGTIEIGKKADLVILKYPNYKFLVYNTGANIVEKVVKDGEVVYEA